MPSDDASAIAAATLTQAIITFRAANPGPADRKKAADPEFVLQLYRDMLSAVRNGGRYQGIVPKMD